MITRKLATALSMTVGLAMMAGCGQTPGQTAAPGNYDARAQVDGASPSPVASVEPSASPTTEPSAMPSDMASASPSAAPTVVPGCDSCGPGLDNSNVGPGIDGSVGSGSGLGAFQFGDDDLVAFQSDRATGGGAGFDIFVFDAKAATVLALPAVNTDANESEPRLSSNAEWLVYETDANGTDDIYLFSMRTLLINSLRTLNTQTANEQQPDVSNDGRLIAFVSDETGPEQLRVYDIANGANYIVPVANRGLTNIDRPTISGNGNVVAYAATAAGEDYDVFVYSLRDAAQLTPPFINTEDDEWNPDLSDSGDRVLFVSDRRGSADVYLTDLQSGFTDNLVLANTASTEEEPRFLGRSEDRIVFQSDRTGNNRIYAYDRDTGLLDTLPVANEPVVDTQLRN